MQAEVWQSFNIKSIEKISTSPVRELTGREIVIHVITSPIIPEDKFTAWQFEMKYDVERMEFVDFNTDNLITASGSILLNSNTPGVLKVGYMSVNNIAGEGSLINLQFKLKSFGVVRPEILKFLYNSYNLSNFEKGDIEVIAYGDVDYNQEVQSYDASMVLINSVGLNPIPDIDSYPWEALRNDVADVDGTNSITATDAANILKKSVGLIDKFPIENPGPLPVGKSSKIKSSENADIAVEKEDYQLVFRSYGDFMGMNLSITGDLTALDMPIISTSVMHAKNITVDGYHVGLAAAIPPADGSVIMQIPLKNEIAEDLILNLNINNQEKIITIEKSISGIQALHDSKLHFYPNPVTDYIYLSAEYQNATVNITDSRGCIVHQEQMSDTRAVNLNSLSSGMYIISITDANGRISTGKLMKR